MTLTARPWFCRLFHHDPIFAREGGQAVWECGTATCRKRWARWSDAEALRPEQANRIAREHDRIMADRERRANTPQERPHLRRVR